MSTLKIRSKRTATETAFEKMKRMNFITEKRAAGFLGVHPEKMDKLRQEQELPFIKIDRSTRMYHYPDLFKWLLSRKTVLTPEKKSDTD